MELKGNLSYIVNKYARFIIKVIKFLIVIVYNNLIVFFKGLLWFIITVIYQNYHLWVIICQLYQHQYRTVHKLMHLHTHLVLLIRATIILTHIIAIMTYIITLIVKHLIIFAKFGSLTNICAATLATRTSNSTWETMCFTFCLKI